MTLSFKENKIPYSQDHFFLKGIPSNIKFTVDKSKFFGSTI